MINKDKINPKFDNAHLYDFDDVMIDTKYNKKRLSNYVDEFNYINITAICNDLGTTTHNFNRVVLNKLPANDRVYYVKKRAGNGGKILLHPKYIVLFLFYIDINIAKQVSEHITHAYLTNTAPQSKPKDRLIKDVSPTSY